MPPHDLIRLADLALAGRYGSQLPVEVLRAVVEATGAEAGVLRLGEQSVARWPQHEEPTADESSEGWEQVPSPEGFRWTLGLLRPETLDQGLLTAARLALRAWDLKGDLKRSRFDERFRLWELEAIRSIATSIGGILEPARLADELIAHLVGLLGVRSARLFLGPDPGNARCVAAFGGSTLTDEELSVAWSDGLYGEMVVGLPLKAKDATLGVLAAAHKEARAGTEPFTSNDIRLLELFAVQTTVALENARLSQESLERDRLNRELEVAAVIQSHLYPGAFPDFPGFRLAARSLASRQVAGDSFDVVVEDGWLLATVADVSGKGVGAGMLASGIHAGVRMVASEDRPLESLASRLNQYLSGVTADNRFATMMFMRFLPDGTFTAVNAGHCPALIRRRDGLVEQIASTGMPLGILDRTPFCELSGCLAPGDLVVIYTDGFTEAENAEEEEFGVERVEEALAVLASPDAEAVCDRLLEVVDEHTGGASLQDDATLLVIERLPSEGDEGH